MTKKSAQTRNSSTTSCTALEQKGEIKVEVLVTPHVLPTSLFTPLCPYSAIYFSSLASSGKCCCQVTDGHYPLLSCPFARPSGQNYAVCDPNWVVMTEYGSVCSPCCFQGQFIQAREKRWELSRSGCISSSVRHRTEKLMGFILIFHKIQSHLVQMADTSHVKKM